MLIQIDLMYELVNTTTQRQLLLLDRRQSQLNQLKLDALHLSWKSELN